MAKDLVCGMEVDEKRAVVAMSGGGGSSVPAAILKEEGYQVVGVMVWPE